MLLRVNEHRNILHEIRKRKANWIGHILRRICLVKQIIEEKIKGQIEVTRWGRRRKKLLDDLKDGRGYCQLKEEALDRTTWRNRFGRGFGPVVWQITDDDETLTFVEEHPFEARSKNLQRRLPCYLPTVVQCTVYFTDMLLLASTRFIVNPHGKAQEQERICVRRTQCGARQLANKRTVWNMVHDSTIFKYLNFKWQFFRHGCTRVIPKSTSDWLVKINALS